MKPTAWLLALCIGCGATDDMVDEDAETCSSGQRWTFGTVGSPEMNPGQPCLDCHGQADTQTFTAAGTVFNTLNEDDDCFGAANVTVEIEDATTRVVTTTTNRAGNFFVEGELFELPVIARIIANGEVRTMPRFVHSTNCNDCHTATGQLGAPGRVLAP